jgi:CheY-like chemotaxis protein
MNTVLVVDDDDSYRELVVLTLEDQCGIPQVLGFGGGTSLLNHLGRTPELPELVVLDLHMPETSGLDLMTRIRKVAPEVPIAFLSGAAAPEEREACLAAGACAFMRKPLAYGELIGILQELVRSQTRGAS